MKTAYSYNPAISQGLEAPIPTIRLSEGKIAPRRAGLGHSASLPVIVLTGAEPERAAEALSLGADKFLAKPFSLSVLGAAVERLLRQAPDGGRG